MASLLKVYGSNTKGLSVTRVEECVMLRVSGLCVDGRDDHFITRVWGEFFGGVDPNAFTFMYRRPVGRARRFRHASGSKSVHQHLASGAASSSDWSMRLICQAPRVGATVVLKSHLKGSNGKRWTRRSSEWVARLRALRAARPGGE